MQCYSELTPPTAVTHSVALPFLSAQSNNLVVAKSSLVQIFRTKTLSAELDNAQNGPAVPSTKRADQPYVSRMNDDDDGLESSFLGGDAILLRPDRGQNTKLVLVAEFPLSGTVTGLARIKRTSAKSGGDLLLVACRDAKLSLVEWDPERYTLSTLSIHYYEQDGLRGSPWAAPLGDYANLLISDPGSRCAALKFGARNLAILPFKHADEDIDMDWDEGLDGPRPPVKDLSATVVNGASDVEETPYSPSFVLRLSNLDPGLIHPVHLAFLHEYREPTFGILSSDTAPAASLSRRDHFTYMVFTLDLQQKASTTILSVGGLPQDLFQVIALPAPVGGALLVGANELIHIDQSGKANGVAVNPFTKQATSFGLADQADLGLRLEGCTIDILSPENGELLIILDDGRLALLSFRIDGRTVSGLSVKLVPPEAGGSLTRCAVSSLSRIGRDSFFAGSEDGDSVVLGWNRKQTQVSRRKSRLADVLVDPELEDDDMEEEDDDEDDLYGDGPAVVQSTETANGAEKKGDLVFRIHDRLMSIAPIRDFTYGKVAVPSDGEAAKDVARTQSDLQLVCAVGRGSVGSLAVMNREINSRVVGKFEFLEARGFWTMSAKKPIPKSLQGDKSGDAVGNDYDTTTPPYDKFMIVAKEDLDGYETSDVYALTSAGFETLTGTEFEPAAGFTVEAGTMGDHTRIIQVLKAEVRCYDGDLGLSQILPMMDEETGVEPRVVSASIADPFLLLVRDDSSVFLAQMDKTSELEELEKEDQTLLSTKWLAGCLYADTHGTFAEKQTDQGVRNGENILMFLLSASGALYIYALPDLSHPVYVAAGLGYIPPILSADFTVRRGSTKETITEVLVADLGDATHTSPFMILRHGNDDLTLYEPLRTSQPDGEGLAKTLRFQKLPNPTFARSPEVAASQDEATNQHRNLPLRASTNIGGYSSVFLAGASPSFIVKSSKSLPRVIGLHGSGVRAMSSFHTEGCERGFIYADSGGITTVAQLPSDYNLTDIGLPVQKIPLGVDASNVAYHPPTGVYAIGCSTFEPFELPKDDDYHKSWAVESITFKPTAERGLLKLISPVTWTIIDTVQFEPCEVIMCVEALNLEVSESTNERKHLITVGTAISRGEDLPIKGRIHVFDVASVIPEPGKPETDRKLKLIAKEDIPRGAVTALSEIGTQGLMLVAQGQKCMVRGLKEDGTLLPVAFMDMSCYVTSARELPGTGLCVMSDAFKGVWFTGYTEEPYRMMLFGKSNTTLEALNVDLLPDGEQLHIVASDADGNIHVLEFDPEHPKSLQGHLLLHRTTFSAGAHLPLKSLLLPCSPLPGSSTPTTDQTGTDPSSSSSPPPPQQLLLLASPTGVLAALRPLSESAYRRLSSLAGQLATSLPHPAGLNPKAYRMASSAAQAARQPPGVDAAVGRSIVDGAVLARWTELGSGRRAEMAGRVGFGGGADEVRAELEGVLGWAGMGYF